MTVRILNGDCRSVLRTLPDASVQCIVSSPPYLGLRDYNNRKQIGLETSIAAYLGELVAVFHECRRVLRPDGVLWVNLGDTYASGHKDNGGTASSTLGRKKKVRAQRHRVFETGLAGKQLLGMPWRLAFALQADGWFLRRDIIWHKLNPMPESVNDRPTTTHEYVFMFSKNARHPLLWRHGETGQWLDRRPEPEDRWRNRKTGEVAPTARVGKDWLRTNVWTGFDYYYDADAIKEPSSPDSHARAKRGRSETHKHADGGPGAQTIMIHRPSAGRPKAVGPNSAANVDRVPEPRKNGVNPKASAAAADVTGIRVKQNESWSEALGSAQLLPFRNKRSVWPIAAEAYKGLHFATFPPALVEPCIKASTKPGDVVLDPFGGVGTTGLVADRLQRDAILIELNPDYCAQARDRIDNDRGELERAMLAETTIDLFEGLRA